MKLKTALIFAAVLLLAVAIPVFAQTASTNAVLKFVVSTTRTDGSTITGPLTYYALYGGKGTAASAKTRYATAIKPDGSTPIPNIPLGTCFQVVTSELQPGNVPIESSPTNEACLPFAPNSASGLTVTVSIQISTP